MSVSLFSSPVFHPIAERDLKTLKGMSELATPLFFGTAFLSFFALEQLVHCTGDTSNIDSAAVGIRCGLAAVAGCRSGYVAAKIYNYCLTILFR
jgi:hypothetical protein